MKKANKETMIIASDFDGTLRRGGEVSAEDTAAVREWQERGNLFGLVTGRDLYAAHCAIDCCKGFVPDFTVCCSGAYLMNSEFECEYSAVTDLSRLAELTEYITERSPLWLSRCLGDRMLGVPVGLNSLKKIGERDETGRLFCTPREFAEGNESCFNIIHTAFETPELAKVYGAEMNRLFDGYISCYQNEKSVDITGSGISKSSSLRQLALMLGVPEGRVITIGDNINDIGMLRDFGGYAVESGRDEAKAAAHGVCASVSELVRILLK